MDMDDYFNFEEIEINQLDDIELQLQNLINQHYLNENILSLEDYINYDINKATDKMLKLEEIIITVLYQEEEEEKEEENIIYIKTSDAI